MKTIRKFLAVTLAVPAMVSALTITEASAAVRPHAAATLVATAGNGQANVIWSAGDHTISHYVVTSSPGAFTCDTEQTSCVIQGLTNGTSYTFSVVGYGDGTFTSWPTSNAVTPQGVPLTHGFNTRTFNLSGYASGKTALTASMKTMLDQLASQIKTNGVTSVAVAGHTDSVGNFATNGPLSVARARVAAAYLQSALTGLGATNVTVTVSGRADRKPVASNATAAGRAQNRRVSFTVSIPFTSGKQDQTITAAASDLNNGGVYNVSSGMVTDGNGGLPTATSGLPVTLHLEATSTAIGCAIGEGISASSSGTCVVTALQTGNDSWNAAPGVQVTFHFVGQPQGIYLDPNPRQQVVNGGYSVYTGASSNLTVTYSIDSGSTADGCTVDAYGNVAATSIGTCVVNFDQAGNIYYAAAPTLSVIVNFTPAQQNILNPSNLVGTVATTATSGLPVSYAIYPGGTATNCAVDDTGVVTADSNQGTCHVMISQSGNSTYWDAAASLVVTATFANGLTIHHLQPSQALYVCQTDANGVIVPYPGHDGGFGHNVNCTSPYGNGSNDEFLQYLVPPANFSMDWCSGPIYLWTTQPTQDQINNLTGWYTNTLLMANGHFTLPSGVNDIWLWDANYGC